MAEQCSCLVHNENVHNENVHPVFKFTSQLSTGNVKVSHGLNTRKGKDSA